MVCVGTRARQCELFNASADANAGLAMICRMASTVADSVLAPRPQHPWVIEDADDEPSPSSSRELFSTALPCHRPRPPARHPPTEPDFLQPTRHASSLFGGFFF